MQKHIVHFALIIMLAVAPLQTAMAGLAELAGQTNCDMGGMHAGQAGDEQPASADDNHGGPACDCCDDCPGSICMSLVKVPYFLASHESLVAVGHTLPVTPYTLAKSSQYPPTDIRPPIVLD